MTYPIKCIMPRNRKLCFKDSTLTTYQTEDICNEDEFGEDDWVVENDGVQVEVVDEISDVHKLSAVDIGVFFGFTYVPRIIFLHESDLRNYRMWSLNSVCINFVDDGPSVNDVNYCGGVDVNVLVHNLVMGLPINPQMFDAEISSMLEKGGILDNLFLRYIPDAGDCAIGYGLFVHERVEIGTMIGEYVGILHTTALIPSSYSLNYPSSDGNREIDASEYGNLIRFVNHSINPNSSFQHFLHDEILHIVCVSLPKPPIKIVLHPLSAVTKDSAFDVPKPSTQLPLHFNLTLLYLFYIYFRDRCLLK